MNVTPIEWTTFSANPIKYRDAAGKVVWACVHASPGCQHCYSETLAKRYGKGGPFNVPTTANVTPFADEAELHKMLTAKRIGGLEVSGSRCFVGDMTDVFGDWVPDALLDEMFAAFALRSDVTWQVLTKRADRMRAYITSRGAETSFHVRLRAILHNARNEGSTPQHTWPLPNVWLGVSAEDQQRADQRIPHLLQTPAAVRFVSAEPLLGPLNLSRYLEGHEDHGIDLSRSAGSRVGACVGYTPPLDWVIPGGESGHGARLCEVEWIESLVKQCVWSGVACFVKQLGAKPASVSPTLDEWPRYAEWTSAGKGVGLGVVKLRDKKGGTADEWPLHLRVRQFPEACA